LNIEPFFQQENLVYKLKNYQAIHKHQHNNMANEKVNLREKLTQFDEYWSPRIVGKLNGQLVKLAKLKGEFVWHHHDDEDELFYVLKGQLKMELRDRTEILNEGDMFIVPKGVEHRPVAEEEVHIMLFEPESTLNTGNLVNERTVEAKILD
jgi:mannose-6-phosphate isomerase-like protein (cupin superfamily)